MASRENYSSTGSGLTIHSSRRRFAARLNSSVRPARAKPAIARQCTSSSGNLHHASRNSHCAVSRRKLTCIELQTAFSSAPRSRSTARKRWQSKSKPHTSDGLPDFVIQIDCQACALRSSEQEHRPNNSFKPSPLRGLGANRAASGGPA